MRERTMARIKRDPEKVKLAEAVLAKYQPETVEDMQDALKDIFGPMFEAMLKGEMSGHLGFQSNDHQEKKTTNRRNGYTEKRVKTSAGEVEINVPRDREASFEPELIAKRQRDVSGVKCNRKMHKSCRQKVHNYCCTFSPESLSLIIDKTSFIL